MSLATISKKFAWGLLVLSALSLAPGSAFAEDKTPSGQELIERFVELCGGREAFAKIRNRAIAARLELPDHGMEGELIEIFAPPDYRRILLFDVYGPIITGLTEGVPWNWSESGEQEPMEAAMKADMVRHAQFNPFLDWGPESGVAKVLGESVVEEEECYRVEIKPVDQASLVAFFSKKTGLLRRLDDRTASMFRRYDDYRKLDGVLVPYKVRLDAGMMGFELEYIRIEQNVDLKEFVDRDLMQAFAKEEVAEMLGLTEEGTLGGEVE